jgi:hypothetical protein
MAFAVTLVIQLLRYHLSEKAPSEGPKGKASLL